MNFKKFALLGWSSGFLFWTVYFVMSAIRPEYFHKYKAVSELGSIGAPNAILWNFFGFISVGILISVFSIGLHRSISMTGKGKLAFYFLFGSGLFWIFAGIFPGNFEDRTSVTMILHTVGSMGSGLFFVLSVFSYIPAMRLSPYWSSAVIPSLSIVVIFILSGFLRSGSAPALGQKIGFLIYFIWLAYMAYKLSKAAVNNAIPPTSG